MKNDSSEFHEFLALFDIINCPKLDGTPVKQKVFKGLEGGLNQMHITSKNCLIFFANFVAIVEGILLLYTRNKRPIMMELAKTALKNT